MDREVVQSNQVEVEQGRQGLQELGQTVSQHIGRRLLFWLVRWIIGFGVIAIVVHYWPQWSWLWWAGGVVASLSLLVLLGFYFLFARKSQMAQSKIEDLEVVLQAEEDENHGM